MKLIEESEKNLVDLHKAVKGVKASDKLNENIIEYLSDDLNTSKVLAELHSLKSKDPSSLKKVMEFLDIYDESFYENNKDLSNLSITENEILNLINERINAKKK